MARQVFSGIKKLYTLTLAAAHGARRVRASDLSLVEDAAMVVEAGRIAWLGLAAELPAAYRLDETINIQKQFSGSVVMPAFVECHTHLVYAGDRSAEFELRLGGESYQSIARRGGGILSTVKATNQASEEELVNAAQRRVDRFVQQGVTTLEIKSGYGLSAAGEEKMLRAAGQLLGPRIVRTFLGPHAIAVGETSESYLEKIINEQLPRIAELGLAERVDIFIEQGYFSAAQARRYFSKAQALGFKLTAHAEQLSRQGGAALSVTFNAQSADHVIEIDGDDITQLAASETTAVLLPCADLYMKCKYPPARRLIDAGARVALATDHNPGTSPTQDLALVGLLARLEMQMSLPEVIAAYTIGAAFALGVNADVGSLESGKLADFIVLSSDIEETFYRVGEMPIAAVYSAGARLK